MSIEAIKQELANLDVAERHKIMAYLIAMEDSLDEAHGAEMARVIDDKNPEHWMTLEDLDRRLKIHDVRTE